MVTSWLPQEKGSGEEVEKGKVGMENFTLGGEYNAIYR